MDLLTLVLSVRLLSGVPMGQVSVPTHQQLLLPASVDANLAEAISDADFFAAFFKTYRLIRRAS